jgi:hypothetical protein
MFIHSSKAVQFGGALMAAPVSLLNLDFSRTYFSQLSTTREMRITELDLPQRGDPAFQEPLLLLDRLSPRL